jgi:hypothetical protein
MASYTVKKKYRDRKKTVEEVSEALRSHGFLATRPKCLPKVIWTMDRRFLPSLIHVIQETYARNAQGSLTRRVCSELGSSPTRLHAADDA